MSRETIEWLNQNSLIGFTDERGKAWHHLEGVDNHFAGAIPVERMLELMSYPLAEGVPTVTVLGDDGVTTFEAKGHKGIVRLDTGEVFKFFKEGYRIHQPKEWLVNNLDTLTHGGLNLAAGLLLRGGAVAAVQAELEDTRTGAEGVKHRPYITAATSMDGSLATTYLVGTRLWVCDNTLTYALAENSALRHKVRHSSNSLGQMVKVRDNLGLVVEQVGDVIDTEIARLTSEFVSDDRWAEFTKAFTGLDDIQRPGGKAEKNGERRTADLNRLWNHDDRVAPWKNSAWGVLAAVNTAEHHVWGTDDNRETRNGLRTVQGKWDGIDRNTLRVLATV
jgi:phage/plasmid-like protein (TIGR03299 family)